jgi:hypothetical protein
MGKIEIKKNMKKCKKTASFYFILFFEHYCFFIFIISIWKTFYYYKFYNNKLRSNQIVSGEKYITYYQSVFHLFVSLRFIDLLKRQVIFFHRITLLISVSWHLLVTCFKILHCMQPARHNCEILQLAVNLMATPNGLFLAGCVCYALYPIQCNCL